MAPRTALRASVALALCYFATAATAQDTTIATVNNGDMIRMQGYTDHFTQDTGIGVEWVTLEENVLRQRVATDITARGGQFDIMTIGMYETPIWGANGWLVPLDEWEQALTSIVDLMNSYGPPGYATNGFNENVSLFQQGRCGMWIDTTVAASFVTNPDDSSVADSVGFALAPNAEGTGKRSNWLCAWALAIPDGTQKEDAAN